MHPILIFFKHMAAYNFVFWINTIKTYYTPVAFPYRRYSTEYSTLVEYQNIETLPNTGDHMCSVHILYVYVKHYQDLCMPICINQTYMFYVYDIQGTGTFFWRQTNDLYYFQMIPFGTIQVDLETYT